MVKKETMKKAVVGLVAFNVVASTMITTMPTQSKAAETPIVQEDKKDTSLNPEYLGDIGVTSGGAIVQMYENLPNVTLTDGTKQSAVGGLMTRQKVNLLEDFNFWTSLYFGDGNADGISFVMQNNASPSVFGNNGDGMGLSGLKNAIGIAIRAQSIYQPSRENVSVYANGQFLNNQDTKFPLTHTGLLPVEIHWRAETRTLSYVIAGVSSSYQVANLTETFGGTSAYVGLVGVTGSGTNLHMAYSPFFDFGGHDPVIDATDKNLWVGQTFDPLAGVTATDVEDGNLTSNVKIAESNVDTNKAGVYNIRYYVDDYSRNRTIKTITVTVSSLPAPTITPVTDRSTSITVTGEPASDLTLILPDGTRVIKKADANGTAVFPVSNLVANQEVKAYQTQYNNSSDITSQTVVAVAADAPTIAPFTTGDTQLVVTGEAGARISVKLPDGSEMSKTAGTDGKATFTIGKQDLGAVIEATQTGGNGKTSAPASVTVTPSPVAKPTINPVSATDTKVTGTGTVGATVTITVKDKTYTGNVDGAGQYSITIPTQTAGTTITAQQAKDGQNSEVASTVVKDATPGKVTLNAMDNHATAVTGKGTPGLTAETVLAGETYATTIKADGTFSIAIPKQVADTIIKVHEKNASGAVGPDTQVKVYNYIPAVAPTINPVFPEQQAITGTVPKDTELVRLVVNGVAQRNVQAVDGQYNIYSRFITDENGVSRRLEVGDVIQVDYGTKTPTNLIAKTTVQAAVVKPTVNPIAPSAEYVTGNVPAGTQTLRLIVNGVAQRVITPTTDPVNAGRIESDGTFSIRSRFIVDEKGTSRRLVAGDVVTIDYGVQISGNTGTSVTVK
ncbi:Ig-like domain-containing protein [Listeria booriae]|uniref:Ig-like domain-containing protein n=1 Tax=Listeria booriae TaxID=1552123 RepID=UPI00162A886C|nr:Ig-like domain-containing protein [Listeria booriae]MBC2327802.1 DUF5011 domain-containing protein [Listeria booriae]